MKKNRFRKCVLEEQVEDSVGTGLNAIVFVYALGIERPVGMLCYKQMMILVCGEWRGKKMSDFGYVGALSSICLRGRFLRLNESSHIFPLFFFLVEENS